MGRSISTSTGRLKMALEENKKLVSLIADEIWNEGKLTVCDDIMHVDAKYHGPHMPDGTGTRENWKQAIAMYRNVFPDSHVTYEELIANDDTVVGRWSATGTHKGKLPGIEQITGKQIAISGITIYRIANGKIIEAWEQLDLLGMWLQLGVISLPVGEKK
jgi:predicted ester cyclase